MKIVLIGSGQVATHLGRAIQNAGHDIVQVWSRSAHHAHELAQLLGTESTDQWQQLKPADLFLIAVQDDAIGEVAQQLTHIKQGVIAHTSGSTSLAVLEKSSHPAIGVLYPLQTFSKQKEVNFREVPLAIEGSNTETTELLVGLAQQLSDKCFLCDSAQRIKLHMAAVFACNFTNHLYAIADEILGQESFSLDLIRPLILETAQKALAFDPKNVQTGPAIRGDQQTIQKHLFALQKMPEYQSLYQKLSESIQASKKKVISDGNKSE
jgi:predicted short-subunit dehydrogenase-like oxidoreductase (DUF2520 family)